MELAIVRTPRLDLVPMSPAFMAASLGGRRADAEGELGATVPADWPGKAERFLRIRLDDLAHDPSAAPWLIRATVLREPARVMVGHVGFHGEPSSEGVVEIGYTTFPPFQRQGFAKEAAVGLLHWAAGDERVKRFRASVGPWNAPSLALVEALGFRRVGTQIDEEDGEELVFERAST
jgi:[ribosomal protein S5]-alanine N-acetyltransferase